jgi:hypothetical protein
MYYIDKIKEDKMGGHVTRMGNNAECFCENINGRDLFGNPRVDRRIILKWTSKK